MSISDDSSPQPKKKPSEETMSKELKQFSKLIKELETNDPKHQKISFSFFLSPLLKR